MYVTRQDFEKLGMYNVLRGSFGMKCIRAPGASNDDRGVAVKISCVTLMCPSMEGSAPLFEYVYNVETTFSTF